MNGANEVSEPSKPVPERQTYQAIRCPCGSEYCKNWLVDPCAAYQGVSFTEQQAREVANLLNQHPEWERKHGQS